MMRKGCVCADKPTQIPTSTFITLCEWVGDPFRSRAACLDLLLWGRSLLCIENEDRNGDRRSQWRTTTRSQWKPRIDRNGDRRTQWRPKNAMETEECNGDRRTQWRMTTRTQWRPKIAMENDD